MENKVQFRNHFSIIFQKSLRGIVLVFFAFVGSFLSDVGEMESSQMLSDFLFLLAIFGVVLLLVIGYQTIVWARTTITISDNTIVLEKRTLNRKVHTIGIKSISNVNLEQNVVQMLLGTSTVKLDTNSLSTADKTDVTIVLKKKDAQEFRQAILNWDKKETVVGQKEPATGGYAFGTKGILLHGLFTTSILGMLFLLVLIGGAGFLIYDALQNPAEGLLQAVSSILVSAWVIIGYFWAVVKNFIKYADFHIERKEDRVYLNYGILKKVAYSIPVDKINAVKIHQTSIARLFKYYAVEVVNVGIDDDAAEEGAYFLPYVTKDKLKELLDRVLPEFSDCLEMKEERQPKSIWVLWLPAVAIYSLIMAAVFGISMELAWTYMGDSEGFEWVVLGGIGILSVLILVCKVAAYFTRGCSVRDDVLQVVTGRFYKQTVYMKYDKIQYLEVKQNILAKKYGIIKGSVHILASAKSQVHLIPYCREEVAEKLKIVLLASGK